MEKKMETTVMDYIRTTTRIHSFFWVCTCDFRRAVVDVGESQPYQPATWTPCWWCRATEGLWKTAPCVRPTFHLKLRLHEGAGFMPLAD